eukprot:TRINITY_DN36834_c0_g1_i1.p1 TRINITY_DN36834_c0_g1~~TRINITY_DN36834_c0_g1_i1.p1  ORF type:complete len:132 (-),score=39.58 TRINITY_DN36834_c0_g1_i1:54-428(-)
MSKIRATLPTEKDFASYVNGKEVNAENESDDSEIGSRSTTYTNLSNLSSRRPSSFDFWPDEIQLENLTALSKDKEQLRDEEAENDKREQKEEVFRPNSSNILLPNKPPVQKPCMDYLKVKPVHL